MSSQEKIKQKILAAETKLNQDIEEMTRKTKTGMDQFYEKESNNLDGTVQDSLENFAVEIEQQ